MTHPEDPQRKETPQEPPQEPQGEADVGGMTGATGSLTPPEGTEPFVPAELREISDPEHHAAVTHGMHSSRPSPSQPSGRGEPRDDEREPEHY